MALALATSCHFKDVNDDPKPVPVSESGRLRCLAEGAAISAPAKATVDLGVATGTAIDLLTIEANTGHGIMNVLYTKPKGAPNTEYSFTSVRYEGTAAINYTEEPRGTITKTAAGWSGTFTVKRTISSTLARGLIADGSFKDVQE
jgi:hypothetical protein